LVKGYVRETQSEDVVDLIERATLQSSTLLAVPEVLSAIARGRRSRVLDDSEAERARSQFLSDGPDYVWLTVDREVINRAAELVWRHALRAIDAIHLATAMSWTSLLPSDETLFATFDKQLARAARSEGLTVWPDED
jgi:predicted nucleic acid-binding protein